MSSVSSPDMAGFFLGRGRDLGRRLAFETSQGWNDVAPARLAAFPVPDTVWDFLRRSRRAGRRLSRDMSWLAPDCGEIVWTEGQPRQRLALLPAPELLRLTLWFGLVLRHRSVIKTVSRPALTVLLDLVGEEGREFVLRRAPLLVGDIGGEEGRVQDLNSSIISSGCVGLAACLAGAPDGWSGRAWQKLPPDFLPPPASTDAGSVTEEAWRLMRKLVTRESPPETRAIVLAEEYRD